MMKINFILFPKYTFIKTVNLEYSWINRVMIISYVF